MESELFFKARLDRANQLQTARKNRTAACINRERVGCAFARIAAHSGLKTDIA
jgi:hypothetical protein